MTINNPGTLRDTISSYFDRAELKALCFDLGVDFEELSGTRKSEKSQALIQLLARRDRLPELLDLLEEKRPAVDWDSLTTQPTTDEKPPFMGLKYFDQEDAELFYGRETVTAVLLSNLQTNPFLAVVGASGSGKSSLVRAGVLPALTDDLIALWGLADGASILNLPVQGAGIEALAFAPNGHQFASGDTAGSLTVWAIPALPPVE